jgi:hypothetical protein
MAHMLTRGPLFPENNTNTDFNPDSIAMQVSERHGYINEDNDNVNENNNSATDVALTHIAGLIDVAQRANEVEAERGYGAIFTLARRMRSVFRKNAPELLEPLNLVLEQVYNYVEQNGFEIHFTNTYSPDEVIHALKILVNQTIGELPEVDEDNYIVMRSIVNPIVETADFLIRRFGAWLTPAVQHINNNLFEYLNNGYQKATAMLPNRGAIRRMMRDLPTIEKIYIGDSLVQAVYMVSDNKDLIIQTLFNSSSFAKIITDFGVDTIDSLLNSIASASDFLHSIQGFSFNLLVFTIILTHKIWEDFQPNKNITKYLKELCATYAGRALFKLRGAWAESEVGRAAAIKYGNLIYDSITLTMDVIKHTHLITYATNPFLMTGFIAYAVARYIHSFHSPPHVSLTEAFADTYHRVFGKDLPRHVIEYIDGLKEVRNMTIEHVIAREEKEAAAEALMGLIDSMGNEEAGQGALDDAGQLQIALGEPPQEAEVAPGQPGPAHEGGKARRRKTIKKKHAKKAHKGKSKKAGKVRKVKKARKSKAKKAHKGKRHTKRRS